MHMRPGTDLHHRLMRVLPFLTYTNQSNMGLLINHFDGVLNFTKVSLMLNLSFRFRVSVAEILFKSYWGSLVFNILLL